VSRILCVDEPDGGRSEYALSRQSGSSVTTDIIDSLTASAIIAQTYLELLRVRTANSSKTVPPRWLFSHVCSSVLVSTSSAFDLSDTLHQTFISAHTLTVRKAIDALKSQLAGFDSSDYPDEKANVLRKMELNHFAGSIETFDKCLYDYVLCFEKKVFNALNQRRKQVNHHETTNLEDETRIKHLSENRRTEGDADPVKLARSITIAVKS
jgi:hypothetical protein